MTGRQSITHALPQAFSSFRSHIAPTWLNVEHRCVPIVITYFCSTNVGVIEFSLLDKLKTVSDIKAVGFTVAKGSHTKRNASGIRLHENMSRDRAADTFALGARRHIEVVEKQPLRLRFHDNEPDPFTVNLNMVGTRGGESRETAALRERG